MILIKIPRSYLQRARRGREESSQFCLLEVKRNHPSPEFMAQIMFLKHLKAIVSETESRTCTFKGSVEGRSSGSPVSRAQRQRLRGETGEQHRGRAEHRAHSCHWLATPEQREPPDACPRPNEDSIRKARLAGRETERKPVWLSLSKNHRGHLERCGMLQTSQGTPGGLVRKRHQEALPHKPPCETDAVPAVPHRKWPCEGPRELVESPGLTNRPLDVTERGRRGTAGPPG